MSVQGSARTRTSNRPLTAVLCLSGIVVALQHTLVVPLLLEFPTILGVDYASVSWLVTVTLLTASIATPILSRLADMFGKRLMMLVSLAAVVVGSLVAAVGGTFLTVLIGRGLQGLASALVPIAIAIMRDELPAREVAGATALMSATLGIGSALGLPLPGILYAHVGWQAIFLMSAVAGAVLFVAMLVVVPESLARTRRRFDTVGAVLLSTALVGLLLAITKGGTWGWTDPRTVIAAAVGIVMLAALVPVELRAGQPLVDLRTSGRRPVLLTNIAGLLVGVSMYANMLTTTQQLTMTTDSGYGSGLSVLTAGLCLVPAGLMMLVFSPVAALMIRRFGAGSTLVVGALILAVAYGARVLLHESVLLIAAGAAVVMVGTTIAYAAMPILIMGSVPITETASSNGLNALARAIGTAISSALISALLTTVTFEVMGRELPTLGAFQLVYVVAGSAALATAVVAAFLPRDAATAAMSGGTRADSAGNLLDPRAHGAIGTPTG
ncbi:MFS transporter [Nocardia sp. NPDC005366]|uniref:MFS transporter n=1 Tax=Nocardia sp. NPDC005366 TaxID=3156878 RepID=UPI0033B9E021